MLGARGTGTLALAVLLALTGSALAGPFDPVFYELGEGSFFVDDCLDCDRPTIEVPIRGTMVLEDLPVGSVGELYSITQIELRTLDADEDNVVVMRGTGNYYRPNDDEASLSLSLSIGDTKGVELVSGTVAAGAKWPAIDVMASESVEGEPRDPLHVYRIRLVAAPDPDAVLYRLVEGSFDDFSGSFFTDECTVCGAPTVPIPVRGRFILVPESVGGPNPTDTYHVAALEVTTLAGSTSDYVVTGLGTYAIGGEVAVLQELTLDVSVNGETNPTLESGKEPLPQGVRFPDIDITSSGLDPRSDIRRFSLHVVAGPDTDGEPTSFRRGDANDDGVLNIADPVYDLIWLFAGGAAPPCLDAGDGNGDGTIDVSDPSYLLDYLFRSGPVPPAPGPNDCGVVEDSRLGCALSLGCTEG